MAERVLVTGATGFIGAHLIERLARSREGARVVGTARSVDAPHNRQAIKSLARLVPLDMRKRASVERLIGKERPDYIFHLAAQSLPTESWRDPWTTLETNILGTTSLFEAVRQFKLDPRIFVACSSAQYGNVPPSQVPVKETRLLEALHPYGVSKVAQDLLAYQYFANYGIKSIRGRIFNTTGPRKTGDVLSDWTSAIVRLEWGGGGILPVGNLRVTRDIADVRDQVRAFDAAVDRLKYGEAYNFSRSSPYKVKDLLKIALSKAEVTITPREDPKLLRPTDERVIWGDNTKLVRALKFRYEIPIEKTIQDMLDFWRSQH